MKNSTPSSRRSRPDDSGRRTLIGRLWMFLAAIGVLEVGWLAGSVLRAGKSRRSREKAGGLVVEAGSVDQFRPGDVKAVPRGKFYLVCLEDGSFLAISRTCTHLGCAVPWDAERERFVCPCHGSSFDRRGEVVHAPATWPLDYFPLRIENGRILVEATAPKRRSAFTPDQTRRA